MPEAATMCVDRWCKIAHDDHGEPSIHVTNEEVMQAAEARSQTVSQVLETIARTAEQDASLAPTTSEMSAGIASGGTGIARDRSPAELSGGPARRPATGAPLPFPRRSSGSGR